MHLQICWGALRLLFEPLILVYIIILHAFTKKFLCISLAHYITIVMMTEVEKDWEDRTLVPVSPALQGQDSLPTEDRGVLK